MSRLNLPDNEKKLIGLLFKEPKLIDKVAGKLLEEDFYDAHNRALFDLLLGEYQKNVNINHETIKSELEKSKPNLSKIGGPEVLTDILLNAGLSTHLEIYVENLVTASKLRKLQASLEASKEDIINSEKGLTTILTELEDNIYKLNTDIQNIEVYSIKNLVEDYIDKLELAKAGNHIKGIASDFKDFDNITGGFMPGNLVIIAARPSMGKTAFSLALALNISKRKSIGFFSIEMPNDQLVQRMISQISTVDGNRFRDPRTIASDDWNKIYAASEKLKNQHKFYIDDASGLTLSDVVWRARRMRQQNNVEIIFIDYLQLINASKARGENRQQEVAEISRTLKSLARELDIPIVALSQLSRRVEQREDKRPIMSDIRESGSIEQDADLIIFLYREDYYKNEKDQQQITNSIQKIEVLISKHRNGPTGAIELKFDLATGGFVSTTKQG